MSEFRVVGFGGAADSGKTTAAEMLVQAADPKHHEHLEFSTPILEAAQQWVLVVGENLTEETCQTHALVEVLGTVSGTSVHSKDVDIPKLDKAYTTRLAGMLIDRQITHESKNAHRPLLEWLGRSAIQLVSPRVWGDTVHTKINQAKEDRADLITVGGVRTAADQQVVKQSNGAVIRLRRGTPQEQLSEYQLYQWPADFDIENNKSLDDLYEAVAIIWSDLQKNG